MVKGNKQTITVHFGANIFQTGAAEDIINQRKWKKVRIFPVFLAFLALLLFKLGVVITPSQRRKILTNCAPMCVRKA